MLMKTTRNAGRLALTLLVTPFFTEAGTQQPIFSSAEIMFNPITVRPQKQVLDWVLQNAGAWPAMRDAVDKRIICEVKSRTGKIINSQTTEVGGMPEIAERRGSVCRVVAIIYGSNGKGKLTAGRENRKGNLPK